MDTIDTFSKELVDNILDSQQNPMLQYKLKVQDKALLLDDNPPNFKENKEKRLQEKQKRIKKKYLGRKARKELGLDRIAPEMVNWKTCCQLHNLWMEYMNDVLQDSANIGQNASNVGQNTEMKASNVNYMSRLEKLSKSDFHGALLTVLKSKIPSNIGKSGIVIKESENMFYIVTRQEIASILHLTDHHLGIRNSSS